MKELYLSACAIVCVVMGIVMGYALGHDQPAVVITRVYPCPESVLEQARLEAYKEALAADEAGCSNRFRRSLTGMGVTP